MVSIFNYPTWQLLDEMAMNKYMDRIKGFKMSGKKEGLINYESHFLDSQPKIKTMKISKTDTGYSLTAQNAL